MKLFILYFLFFNLSLTICLASEAEFRKFYTYLSKNKIDSIEDKNILEAISFFPLLNELNSKELEKIYSPYAFFILGQRNLKSKKITKALNYFEKISGKHAVYIESLIYQIEIYTRLKKFNKAYPLAEECIEKSTQFKEEQRTKKQKLFYQNLIDTCIVNKARTKFAQSQFKEAIDLYRSIDQRSLIWPFILIELAWAHYQLEEFNQSLGILTTYNSPLLKSYFNAEVYYLKALSYFKLCLYQDALKEIDIFYNHHLNEANNFQSEILLNKDTSLFFYGLMNTSIKELDKKNIFIRHSIIQVSKKTKFSTNIMFIKYLEEVLKKDKTNLDEKLLMLKIIDSTKLQINHYVKTSLNKFYKDISINAQRLLLLKLEISNAKKELIYDQTKLISNRARGSYENIKTDQNHLYWTFNNSFWADELGFYSFGLKSNCEIQKDNINE